MRHHRFLTIASPATTTAGLATFGTGGAACGNAGTQCAQHWSDGTAFDEDTSRTFGIVVGIEVVLAAVGAAVLRARGNRDVIPAWIAVVVGIHLFPVAAIVGYPLIHVIGALVTAAALAAIPVARSRSLRVSATNGLGVGTALLAGAACCVMTAF